LISKKLFLYVLSAVLLVLSFPRPNLFPLAWFACVPWFIALEGRPKIEVFLFSCLTGIIFWLGIIYWLAHVTLLGMVIFILYLALYFGIFGLAASFFICRFSLFGLCSVSALWVILEYVRSHLFTGFGWALLGYSQYLNLPVIQIADSTGVWGVSFLVMLVNGAIYLAARSPRPLSVKIKIYIPVFFCALFVLAYGYYRLSPKPSLLARIPIKVAVIQGNIPQELKWNKDAKDYILEKYLALSEAASKENPDLIIWPEAALPVIPEEETGYYNIVAGSVRQRGVPLLFGAVTSRDKLYYNSALFLSSEGKLSGVYDKLHLVPFGEYIPLRNIFPFLETFAPIGDIEKGKDYTIFTLPGVSCFHPVEFSALICFEDLFPELSRGFVNRGADFLVNMTNDAWFKDTSAPYQHLQASVFRAVENHIFLVRSANTGISCFIRPDGQVISLVKDAAGKDVFIFGYDAEVIAAYPGPLTFYTRYGDIFIFLLLIFNIYSIFHLKRYPADRLIR